ncbi:unnamed protein product [Bursaphelenchus okinawaensis]|uniref:Uncharacterized protein n=1 Tax=Bursaphelenchus okinawaensis TaxID=465554 RepID=A0A811JRB2_9BILA|nr:unnamed protein product [Bursaphelenchus okinawaensis]CAG9079599.1 unnamed protein product [Bursaphelenchus okinawaensis]
MLSSKVAPTPERRVSWIFDNKNPKTNGDNVSTTNEKPGSTVPNQNDENAQLQQLENRAKVLTQNLIHQENEGESQLDDFFLYTSISGLRFLHSKNPKWFKTLSGFTLILSLLTCAYHSSIFVKKYFNQENETQFFSTAFKNVPFPSIIVCPITRHRILRENYSPDFAHFLTNFWMSHDEEPVIQNKSLQQWLEELNNQLQRIRSPLHEIDQLNYWSERVAKILPNTAILLNISDALRILKPDTHINNHFDYHSFKVQSDQCSQFLDFRNNNTLDGFIQCRLTNVRVLIGATLNSYQYLLKTINDPPIISDYILRCKWVDMSDCVLKTVNTTLGMLCIQAGPKNAFNISGEIMKYPVRIVIDSQAFNNQADTFKPDEIKIGFHDHETELPRPTQYASFGGSEMVDMDITVVQDFYQYGSTSCHANIDLNSTKSSDKVCIWRNYRFDVSLNDYESTSEVRKLVKPIRKAEWRGIDKVIEAADGDVFYPLLSRRLRRLNEECIDTHINLGRLFHAKNKDYIVDETFAHQVSMFLFKRRFSHTKTLRYYRNKQNLEQLNTYIKTIYNALIVSYNNITKDPSVCSEIKPILHNLIHNSMFSMMNSRNTSRFMNNFGRITQRRDVKVIQKDYASQNFLQIQVRFRTLDREVVSHAPEYNVFQFIADLGGTMGLYFGLSFLTFYEFLVFMFVKDAAIGNEPPPKRNIIYNNEKQKHARRRRIRDVFSAEMRKPKVV